MIGRGIATRIALAALASAAVGVAILAIGITVVGAEIFRALMVEAGDSADHAQAMYDESVTTVVLAAVVVAAIASVALAVVLARMLARPLAEVGGGGPPDRRGRLRGPGPARRPRRSSPAWPIRSTRWPPASNARRRCGATSSPTRRTSCGRR